MGRKYSRDYMSPLARTSEAYPGSIDKQSRNQNQELFLIGSDGEKIFLRDGYALQIEQGVYFSDTHRIRENGSGDLVVEEYDGSSWVVLHTF